MRDGAYGRDLRDCVKDKSGADIYNPEFTPFLCKATTVSGTVRMQP